MVHIFIVNSFAGRRRFSMDLREKLSQIRGLRYFVFNTRGKGLEQELVKEILYIFEGEKLRFYCCGGSGTMENMLNGFENLSKVEVAFFPCGFSNDFLKVFMEKETLFYNIENLIYGKVVKIDYIKTNGKVVLNAASCGLDTNISKKMMEKRYLGIINRRLPYIVSMIYAIFGSHSNDYEIWLDDEIYKGKMCQVAFMNGTTIGGNFRLQTESNIRDGKMDYILVLDRPKMELMKALFGVIKGDNRRLDKISITGQCTKASLTRKDKRSLRMDYDGEMQDNMRQWDIEVVERGLNFVMPRGIGING